MSPKKVMAIVGAIIGFSVLAICVTLFSNDADNYDNIVSKFNQVTQTFNRQTVSSVIENAETDGEYRYTGPWMNIDTSSMQGFLDAAILSHHVFGHAGFSYDPTEPKTVNGIDVNQDCLGHVAFALYLYGAIDSNEVIGLTRNSIANVTGLHTRNAGDAPQTGDILVYPNHVEVFAEEDSNGNWVVVTWGDTDTGPAMYAGDTDTSGSPSTCTIDPRVVQGARQGDPTIYYLDGSTNFTPPSNPGTGGGGTGGGTTPSNPPPSMDNNPFADGKTNSINSYLANHPDRGCSMLQGTLQYIPQFTTSNYPEWNGIGEIIMRKNGRGRTEDKYVRKNGCLLCSLSMISAFYRGSLTNINELRPMFEANTYYNQNDSNSVCARDYNLWTTDLGVSTSYTNIVGVNDVRNCIDQNIAVLVQFSGHVDYDGDGSDSGSNDYRGNGHYTFCVGYTYDKTSGAVVDLMLFDPGRGEHKLMYLSTKNLTNVSFRKVTKR